MRRGEATTIDIERAIYSMPNSLRSPGASYRAQHFNIAQASTLATRYH